MAKQNVTFVERHLEKIVVGVAGAALLASAWLYLMNTPYKVEVDGQKLGTQEFYAQVKSQAETARGKMKNARPDNEPAADQKIDPLDIEKQRSPYDFLNLQKAFPVVFGPLSVPIPAVESGPIRGKIKLADVLAPSGLEVTTGRANARLLKPAVVDSSSRTGGGESEMMLPQDYHWATVLAEVHRADQRAKYAEAKYAPPRQKLVVAAVEAEREELLPDGHWGNATLVSGYAAKVIPIRREVQLFRQDDGTYAVLDKDLQDVQGYTKLLNSSETQAEVLRPDFQTFLAYPPDWRVPADMADGTIQLADYGAVPETAEEDMRPAGPVAPTARSGRAEVTRLLKEVDRAIEEKKYLEVEQYLNEIIANKDALQKQVDEARGLLKELAREIEVARRAALDERERAEAASQSRLGEDVEPCWLTDLSVMPGKTYRYRLRVWAFNPYVGLASELSNPEDAALVAVPGDWSEWSDPVTIEPAVRVFYASPRQQGEPAKVDVFEWTVDKWYSANRVFTPGQALVFQVGRRELSYGAIVADIDYDVTYRERSEGRDGKVTYREMQTASLVLIAPDGKVEEHLAAADMQAKREFVNETKKYTKKRALWERGRSPSRERGGRVRPAGPGGAGDLGPVGVEGP